jgi:hypothetical protein
MAGPRRLLSVPERETLVFGTSPFVERGHLINARVRLGSSSPVATPAYTVRRPTLLYQIHLSMR